MNLRDKHQGWQQGRFVDQTQYRNWPEEQKKKANTQESFLVRPSPLGNAICKCNYPEDAQWVAGRLNLAAKLEGQTTQLEAELAEAQRRYLDGAKEFKQMLIDATNCMVWPHIEGVYAVFEQQAKGGSK